MARAFGSVGRWLAAVLCVAAACAAPARAEEVILNDGTVHDATIVKVEKDSLTVIVRTKTSGKSVTLTVPAKRFDPHWLYGVKDRLAGEDAKAHVELAVWAVEQGMFSRAKAQMMRAEALDPAYVGALRDGKLPDVREGIATSILASANEDIAKGRLEVAEQKLEVLLTRMPDTVAGGQAREVMTALQPKLEEAEAKRAAEAAAKLAAAEKAAAEARAKKLAPIDAELARAKKLAVAGLTEDSDTKALSLLEDAMRRGEKLLKELDALAKDAAADPELAKEVADRRARINAGMVKAHLHRAEIYIFRGDAKEAQAEVAAAQAIDPENPDVAAASVRAEQAGDDFDIQERRWRRARIAAGNGRFGVGGRR